MPLHSFASFRALLSVSQAFPCYLAVHFKSDFLAHSFCHLTLCEEREGKREESKVKAFHSAAKQPQILIALFFFFLGGSEMPKKPSQTSPFSAAVIYLAECLGKKVALWFLVYTFLTKTLFSVVEVGAIFCTSVYSERLFRHRN